MSRAIPESLRPQIGFLVRLLGARSDTAALGAARALGRKLCGAGCDFDDLAAHIERVTAKSDETPRQPPPPKSRSNRAKAWTPPVHVNLDDEARAALLATLAGALADPRLKGWGRWEIGKLVERVERRDPAPTRRMLDRVERIVADLRRVA